MYIHFFREINFAKNFTRLTNPNCITSTLQDRFSSSEEQLTTKFPIKSCWLIHSMNSTFKRFVDNSEFLHLFLRIAW